MAVHSNPDRNVSYMKSNWGTVKLITDYNSLNEANTKKRNKYNIDYCEYFDDIIK